MFSLCYLEDVTSVLF